MERTNKVIQNLCLQHGKVKGSVVEGYTMDETIKFCTKYENFQIYHRTMNFQNKLGIRWMG
jgi:hypothetical protein